MTTELLILLSTYLMAVSLATERFVALVKSIVPWLATERKDDAGLIDLKQERWRTLVVHVVSLIGAWATTSLLNNSPNPAAYLCITGGSENCWRAGVIALLSTGGSAFWNNVLGYATAVKDIKRQERAEQRLRLSQQASAAQVSVNKLTQL